jgi:hypothetical protein
MRRAVLVGLSAITVGALAKPAAPPPTWGDWVGDYTGKLTWSACTVDGAGSATLPLDATDGAVTLDLASAGGALEALPLEEDNGTWTGRQNDVTVRVARPRADAIELSVVLDSGCEVHGTLRRKSTGIAACDRLAGWARVESRCTKLTKPALENVARLVRQRKTWLAAKGDARDKLAAQCDARAQKVELELVDAGCAPSSDPAVGVRGTECQALRASLARLQRCRALPPDVEIQLEQQSQNAVTDNECRALRAKIVATSQQVGCIF